MNQRDNTNWTGLGGQLSFRTEVGDFDTEYPSITRVRTYSDRRRSESAYI